MNRILYVDDEPNVLAGLKRLLHGLRTQWDMTFVTSGAEALECLARSPFDVLMTDIAMPGMNGIELLQEVATRHPEVIRMVLSGTADLETTLQSVSVSHQYLLKPCDAGALKTAIQRAFRLRALLDNPDLRSLVSRMDSLPSVPAVYGELVRVLRSGDASAQAVGHIMAQDMGMTAKLLQLVNSAFFGVSREITDPVGAVVYLGMETVQALVFSAAAFSQFQVCGPCHFSIEDLQHHCLTVAALARRIARSMRLPQVAVDHVFVGGMLHDIGKLVLASNYPEQYQEAVRRAKEGPLLIREAELAQFGTSHAEIGAYLLWLWGLPDAVAEILALHHHPSASGDVAPEVVAVHVANALVRGDSDRELDFDCLKSMGLESALPGWRELYSGLPKEGPC